MSEHRATCPYCCDLYLAEANVNNVTSPAVDLRSKQPELKYAAVRVDPWRPSAEAAAAPERASASA